MSDDEVKEKLTEIFDNLDVEKCLYRILPELEQDYPMVIVPHRPQNGAIEHC